MKTIFQNQNLYPSIEMEKDVSQIFDDFDDDYLSKAHREIFDTIYEGAGPAGAMFFNALISLKYEIREKILNHEYNL